MANRPATKNAAKPAPTAGQASRPIARPAAPSTRTGGFKVRATQLGYYDHTRRRIGDVFMIANAEAFSERWMERVDASTPEHTTLSKDVLKQQHDDILGAKSRATVEGMQVGPDDVPANLPKGTDNPLGAE